MRSIISRSSSSIEPDSVPSLIIALISSSVTVSSLILLMLKILKNRLLVLLSSHTIGWVALAKACIIGATILAILSAFNKPMRFGINSPKTIERNVTMITIIVVEIVRAYGLRNSTFSSEGWR